MKDPASCIRIKLKKGIRDGYEERNARSGERCGCRWCDISQEVAQTLLTWRAGQHWEDLKRHILTLQGSLFAAWYLHSAVCFYLNQGEGRLELLFFASAFAATSGVSVWIRASLRDSFYGGISFFMTGLGGVDEMVAVVSEIPFGALALAGGLTLFALGTLLAKWPHYILGARFDSPIV